MVLIRLHVVSGRYDTCKLTDYKIDKTTEMLHFLQNSTRKCTRKMKYLQANIIKYDIQCSILILFVKLVILV